MVAQPGAGFTATGHRICFRISMKIRPEQVAVLDAAMRTVPEPDLTRLLVQRLSADFPAIDPLSLESWIAEGLRKCTGWEIREAEAVEMFIRLMLVAGRDFDLHPRVAEQLSRDDATPELRLTLLCELLTADDWAAVAAGERSRHVQIDLYEKVLA
jgi:hypothetical protein